MRLAFAAAAVLLLVLSGCFGGKAASHAVPGAPSTPGGPSPLAATGRLPPGCDGNRTAIPHLAGGVPLALVLGPAPIPCLVYTGKDGLESNVAVSKSGTVFYYPAQVNLPGGVANGPPPGIGTMRSQDQGATWEIRIPKVGPVPTHPTTEDPYLYLDPRTGRLFAEDLVFSINCASLSVSDDEGQTWTEGVAGCLEFDHDSYAAGPPVSSPTVGYPDIVYRCGINVVALAGASTTSTCQKTLDGGRTWLPPGEPAFQFPTMPPAPESSRVCDGANGHPWVDAHGWLYVPKGYCGQPWLAISKDEGTTWTRVQVADNGMGVDEAGTVDHEAGVGVDPAGNIYYFWVAHDRLPYLAVSRDGGATWGEPRMVGIPGVKEAALPELAVGGVGKVALVSMQSRNSRGAPFVECADASCAVQGKSVPGYGNVTWDGVMTVSWDALDANATFWSANVNPAQDPLVRGRCGPLRCQEEYDYLDVRIGPDGTPWASLVDGCTKECSGNPTGTDNDDRGVVGRLWGAPSLWDASDPNGPYPGP